MSTPSPSLFNPHWWRDPEFRLGLVHMARLLPGVLAWGLVTGMAMMKAGLPLWVAVTMSLTVYAASAQLAAVPLLMAHAPIWVVVLAALCVNLRFVIFSVQLRQHVMVLPLRWRLLVGYLAADVAYVMSVSRHGRHEAASLQNPAPLSYLLGLCLMNFLAWNVASMVGVLYAERVPENWGMGFAGTLALAGLMVSLVKSKTSLLSAAMAGTAAVMAFGLPYRLNIVVAVIMAVGFGLLMDKAMSAGLPGTGKESVS